MDDTASRCAVRLEYPVADDGCEKGNAEDEGKSPGQGIEVVPAFVAKRQMQRYKNHKIERTSQHPYARSEKEIPSRDFMGAQDGLSRSGEAIDGIPTGEGRSWKADRREKQ